MKRKTLHRLVDEFAGSRGVAFGGAPRGGMHLAIHEGEGATGNWCGVTFSNKESLAFIGKIVRALKNAEHLPEIRTLIDNEERGLRAEITRLRCELLRLKTAPAGPTPVLPYSNATALVVATSRALAVIPQKGGAK